MSNLFSQGGTISLYVTPEAMKAKVDEYFETCFKASLDKEGNYYLKEIKPPTFSGLARYLGFSSRTQLLTYKNEDSRDYDEVIADARMRIEDYLEGKLVYSKAPTGIMFSLKNNAGWEDKTKRELSGDSSTGGLVIGWMGDSGDVIDVAANNSENKGVLPQGGRLLGGTGTNGTSSDGE